jgi:alpha-aminoadipic semialdehyde synthase
MKSMIGIRAEDKNRWERRAPLTPDHVGELVEEQSLELRVQPSARRAFLDRDYRAAGAELADDLSPCRVILGVKEVPAEKLLGGRTYVYFSHVAKGQPANLPMLRRLLELDCTLLDYEQIVDRRGKRLIFFGRHAGYAGMIDTLWALGERFAAEGIETPFERLRQARHYQGLEAALEHLARIGDEIRRRGLPTGRRPLVFGFTGSGNVTRGAAEVFERLPVVDVEAEDLLALAEDRNRQRNALYRAVFARHHRYRRAVDGGFDAAELAAHPDRYESGLEPYLEHLSVLVHGAYWEPSQPRLVTRAMLARLFAGEAQPKLRVIGDLSCDVGGAIEATVRATDPGAPIYTFDPATGGTSEGAGGRGVVVLAVDHLPCELPFEASQHFGDSLVRFVGSLARCDWRRAFEDLDLPPELHRAVIVHRGRLTPGFQYLERALAGGS